MAAIANAGRFAAASDAGDAAAGAVAVPGPSALTAAVAALEQSFDARHRRLGRRAEVPGSR